MTDVKLEEKKCFDGIYLVSAKGPWISDRIQCFNGIFYWISVENYAIKRLEIVNIPIETLKLIHITI